MLQITSYTPIRFTAEPLAYLWVAESPDTIDKETGEVLGENPHMYLMMKWQVPFKHFAAWASRIEALWGHGFAHLEKIKDPRKAGAYVAKAAGYLSKAQGKTDQGNIRGNRQSQSARAPERQNGIRLVSWDGSWLKHTRNGMPNTALK
jgi:hypothetical protein